MEKIGIATKIQKFSHWLFIHKIPLLPRIIFIINRWMCGCSIPASVFVGDGSRFAHNGLGVIVHYKTRIGNNTVIQGNVVLGGKDGEAPRIGDNCLIGAGAVLLGGITIGDNSLIGANAVVLEDVPPNCTVVGVPAHIVKTRVEE